MKHEATAAALLVLLILVAVVGGVCVMLGPDEPTPVPATQAPVLTIIPASPTVYVVPSFTPSPRPEVILERTPLPTATPIPPLILVDTPTPTPIPTPRPERSPVQRG